MGGQTVQQCGHEVVPCNIWIHCPEGTVQRPNPENPCSGCDFICEEREEIFLQNLKVYDGSVFDMGTVYNGDQCVMALGNTGIHQVNFDKIESGQGSTTVFMHI